jgi:hypothetical protein
MVLGSPLTEFNPGKIHLFIVELSIDRDGIINLNAFVNQPAGQRDSFKNSGIPDSPIKIFVCPYTAIYLMFGGKSMQGFCS